MQLTGWVGAYGPAGLPGDIRQKLSNAIVEIVKQPGMGDRFRAIGFEPAAQDFKAFSQVHASEVKRWVAFLTEMGLRK